MARYEQGNIITAIGRREYGVPIKQFQLTAILMRLDLATSFRWQNTVLESDSKNVIGWTRVEQWMSDTVLLDIKQIHSL